MDMYAHPSFTRGHPELLGLLRKNTTASGRKQKSRATSSVPSSRVLSRAVSPSPPGSPSRQVNLSFVQTVVVKGSSFDGSKCCLADSTQLSHRPDSSGDSKLAGAGRLDLLTMALSTLAEREFL